jgi:hypothetical protein
MRQGRQQETHAMSLSGKGIWQTVIIDDPLDATTPLGNSDVHVCTIGPVGGGDNSGQPFDYNTLNAWLAALQATTGIPTDRNGSAPGSINGAPFWAECYSGSNLLSSKLTVNGALLNYTPTETGFLRIYAADGHRANGLYDDRPVPQGALCFQPNGLQGRAVTITDVLFTRVDGLRIVSHHTDALGLVFSDTNCSVIQGNTVQVILRPYISSATAVSCAFSTGVADRVADATCVVRNNVVYGDPTGYGVRAFAIDLISAGPDQALKLDAYLDNNTALDCGQDDPGGGDPNFYTFAGGIGELSSVDLYLYRRNNLSLKSGGGDCYEDDMEGPNLYHMQIHYEADEYNLSSDGTADDYGNTTPESCPVNVTPADVAYNITTDARLRRNSPAVAAGDDLSAVFTADLRGRTRRRWDIGAMNYCPRHHGAVNPTPSTAPAVIP